MPYKDVSEIPSYVKKYSPKLQRMWRYTWMSIFKKTGSEKRAFMGANSVIRRRAEKHGANRYGHSSSFLISVDKFLKNI